MKLAKFKIASKIFLITILLVSTACASTKAPGKLVQATIRVNSVPDDALVMVCKYGDFEEAKAECIGTTPLMRYRTICEAGSPVRLFKSGYHEWNGMLFPESSDITATLVPYTQEEFDQESVVRSFDKIKIVPVRMGVRPSDSKSKELEYSNDTKNFSDRFIRAFEEKMRDRFGDQMAIKNDRRFANSAYWRELEINLQKIGIEKLDYHPFPPRAKFSHDFDLALEDVGGAILFLRAEASYLTESEKSGRIIGAVAMTVVSMAVSSNSPIYTVYSPSLRGDSILAQLFLLNGTTNEVLWFGQVSVEDHFRRKSAVEGIAQKAAMQFPSSFVLQPTED